LAVGKQYSKSVVFISGLLDGDTDPKLRGSGFIVGFRSEPDPDQGHGYIVTAAHVVRLLKASFVRLTASDGSIVDREVDEWIYHPTEDIAVARLPTPYKNYDFLAIPPKEFVGAEEYEWSPEPGAEVFAVGLLGQVPSMGEQNVPMVRTGAIGALYQDRIPMRLADNTLIKVHGHLIDSHSFGGFSGSPCFVRYISAIEKTPKMGLRYPVQSTLLLGMVGGHFDLKSSITLPDQEEKVNIPVAAGVAVVYPAETIREVLSEDAFVAERAELDAQLRSSE
jgi:hypothetical protein